ncbi:unnamed protein product [Pylaiella littoralis]
MLAATISKMADMRISSAAPSAAPSTAPSTAPATCGIPECTRPCHESDGVVHDFCGRTHAAEAVSRGMRARLRRPHGHCHVCKLDGCSLPVFFDSAKNHVYDFCSKRHANRAIADGQWTRSTTSASSSATSKCKLPGCQQSVYADPVTCLESDFCSKTHRAQANTRECVRTGCTSTAWLANTEGPQFCSCDCAVTDGAQPGNTSGSCSLAGCFKNPLHHRQTGKALDYCGEGHRVRHQQLKTGVANAEPYVERVFHGATTGATDFLLSVLSKAHPHYPSLADQFANKWVKPEAAGGVSVEKIFTVEVPADIRRKTKAYERIVGNVRRRFHGTSCSPQCNFFVDLKGEPCSNADCNVCSICTHGFKLQGNVGKTARRTAMALRYGDGLYFSSVSGKANDYATQSEKTGSDGSKLRCMFVANVAAGKAHTTKDRDLPIKMCPPAGYDSVVGEVGQGLNYDELVVYKDEAALPTHLIVYALH